MFLIYMLLFILCIFMIVILLRMSEVTSKLDAHESLLARVVTTDELLIIGKLQNTNDNAQ
jgi:hypothetical protein